VALVDAENRYTHDASEHFLPLSLESSYASDCSAESCRNMFVGPWLCQVFIYIIAGIFLACGVFVA